jgi:hypothetical protein
MKQAFLHLDDYQAQEASLYLTAITYYRIENISRLKWRILSAKIYWFRNKLHTDLL